MSPGGLEYWQKKQPMYAISHFKDTDFGFNIFVSGENLIVALDPGTVWRASTGAMEFESRFDSHFRAGRVFLGRLEKAVGSSSVGVVLKNRRDESLGLRHEARKLGVVKDSYLRDRRILKPDNDERTSSRQAGLYDVGGGPDTLWTYQKLARYVLTRRDVLKMLGACGDESKEELQEMIDDIWSNEMIAPALAPAAYSDDVPFFFRPWGYFLFLLYLWKTRRGGDVLFLGHSMGGAFALGLAARGSEFFRRLAEREERAAGGPSLEASGRAADFLHSIRAHRMLPPPTEDDSRYWIRSLSFGAAFAVCAVDQYGCDNPNGEASLWLEKYLQVGGCELGSTLLDQTITKT